MIIRRVDPLSLAKIQAVVGAVFGFLLAIFWGLSLALGAAFAVNQGGGGGGGPGAGGAPMLGILGVGAVVLVVAVPIVYAIFGFIGGLIAGLVFNLACGMTGGLEVDVDLQGELYEAEDRT